MVLDGPEGFQSKNSKSMTHLFLSVSKYQILTLQHFHCEGFHWFQWWLLSLKLKPILREAYCCAVQSSDVCSELFCSYWHDYLHSLARAAPNWPGLWCYPDSCAEQRDTRHDRVTGPRHGAPTTLIHTVRTSDIVLCNATYLAKIILFTTLYCTLFITIKLTLSV